MERAAVDVAALDSSRDVQSVTDVGSLIQPRTVPRKKENLYTLCTAGLCSSCSSVSGAKDIEIAYIYLAVLYLV